MDLGSLDIQIFVSLVVVLGAAFVALVCDYLKGNNEQLREKNVELRVRSEEREHRWLLDPGTLVPQTLFQQFFAAARQAGWTPEVVAQTAQRTAANPRRATAAAPEPSRVDLEALRRRADSFDIRADDQKRENIAQAPPVAARTPRKSAEDFVSPDVLTKIASIAEPVLVGVAVSETTTDSADTVVALTPEPEAVGDRKTAAGSHNTFAVGESARGEIQRLKEQAKAKFASQLDQHPLNASPEDSIFNENANEENLGDLVVGLNLGEELQHVSNPGFDPSEQERVPVESAAQLQLEIERVTTIYGLEKLADKRPADPKNVQPIVMQPEQSIAELELLEKLRRIATPTKVQSISPEQGLLDQIIRETVEAAPVGQELSEESLQANNEQLLEPAYINTENAEATEYRSHSFSFSHPTSSSTRETAPEPTDHDAILRELLSRKDDLPPDDDTFDAEVLVEEPAALNHPELTFSEGLDRLTASTARPEPPASFFEGDAPSLEEFQELSLPPGLHDKSTFAPLIDTGKSVSGVVIYAGLNDYAKLTEGKTKQQIDELLHPATKLIASIVRDKDFAARVSEDTWLMVFCGELGNAAQRRIDAVSEKFWDFQLRNLGQAALTFSTGAVQVEKESLTDAVAAAKERMEQLRNKGKGSAAGTRKKAVNS